MDLAAVVLLEVLYVIASLIIISSGLAMIFGMMKIINFAHGEFMMLGGYTTIVCVKAGVNIYLAMLVIAPLIVGMIGLLLERLVIRHLYGRLVDTMLATWGISMILIGIVTMIFGNTTESISTPIKGWAIGDYQVNGYNFFIILVAIALVCSGYFLLKFTRLGLIVRGAMQDPNVAASLGYNPDRIYMTTFFMGAALSGLAGGILAPLVGLVPSWGTAYIAKAFITVVVGGPAIIVGLVSSATLFGSVNQIFAFIFNPVFGEVALLLCAVILLRILPKGITNSIFKGKL